MFIYHSVAVFVFFIDDAEVWAGSGFVKSIIHIWCFMYRKIQYGTLLCTCMEERLSGSLVHWRSEGLTYVYGADTVHWLQVNILFGLTSARFPFALFGLELYSITVWTSSKRLLYAQFTVCVQEITLMILLLHAKLNYVIYF